MSFLILRLFSTLINIQVYRYSLFLLAPQHNSESSSNSDFFTL